MKGWVCLWCIGIVVTAIATLANANHDCDIQLEKLIESAEWRNYNLKDYLNLRDNLFSNFRRGESFEGGTQDKSVEDELKIYMSIAAIPCVRTICEIGFNTGASALAWLQANPSAEVLAFDLWEHPYAEPGFQFLRNHKSLNGSRLQVVKGSSIQTVRDFHTQNPSFRCDLISIDGGHSFEIAVQDIENMMPMANSHWNVVFVDDTNCGSSWCVDEVIREHLRRGTLVKLEAFSLDSAQRGISVFKYQKWHVGGRGN